MTANKNRHSADDVIAMTGRMIRASGRHAGESDPEQLAALARLQEQLDDALVEAVRGQREAGVWWSSIAEALGVTKQACIQRWAKKVEAVQQLRDSEVNYLPCPGEGKAALPADWKHGAETPKGICRACGERVMTNPDGTICGHQQTGRDGRPVHNLTLLRSVETAL